jgi:medium-chain acyl-[acyl-carrier-protein] hydrolase
VLQLPGREHRLREKPVATLEAACADLLQQMTPHLDRPFALFGHSMGGLLAFETAHRLRDRGLAPEHLFVSACNPPDIRQVRAPLAHLPDAAFAAALNERYGGIPAAILHDAEFLATFLPALRADFAILEDYRLADRPPLACPITVVYGHADEIVDQQRLELWRNRTTGSFTKRMVDGAHFYLQLQKTLLLRSITDLLRFQDGLEISA